MLLQPSQQRLFQLLRHNRVTFLLDILNQRVDTHKRFLRHGAHCETLPASNHKVVDVCASLRVRHHVVVGRKVLVRGVVNLALDFAHADVERPGLVTGVRLALSNRNSVLFFKSTSKRLLRLLHRKVHDSGQHCVATATSTDVGGGFAAKLGRDTSSQTLGTLKAVNGRVSHKPWLHLHVAQRAATHHTNFARQAVSGVDDLGLLACVADKPGVREHALLHGQHLKRHQLCLLLVHAEDAVELASGLVQRDPVRHDNRAASDQVWDTFQLHDDGAGVVAGVTLSVRATQPDQHRLHMIDVLDHFDYFVFFVRRVFHPSSKPQRSLGIERLHPAI